MKYTATTKPGMGDPYWYEWSVGQCQILEMLKDDSNIKSVELQADIALGLDDVVVSYMDDSILCIQVKHTRAEDSLSFGDLVSASDGKKSILKELADSWIAEKEKYTQIKTQIFTNRKKSVKKSTAGPKTARYIRPSLKIFWEMLQTQLEEVSNYDEISFNEYQEAWREWSQQLEGIEKSDDKLDFLKGLSIESERADLNDIENSLLNSLKELFHVNDEQADLLLSRLDHALRNWSTSSRSKATITVEDVYDALSVNEVTIAYNHDLIPSDPFFASRDDLIQTIENNLKNGENKVLFLSGGPGIGKTNVVSKLCNKRESLITFRYYAYEPIQPGKEYLPMDVSKRVGIECFWNELFNQLRKYLSGNLHHYGVPIVNNFLSIEELRKEFLRIVSDIYNEKKETIVIAIDGIDHAARAGKNETFLNTLPSPEFLPDGVKVLISGQPEASYPNYPNWLKRTNKYVEKIFVPGITREDIKALVLSKVSDSRQAEYDAITDVVVTYCKGNTLSAIFAVYEACFAENVVDFEQNIKNRQLSCDIEQYYQYIWDNVVTKLSRYGFMDYRLAGVFALLNERVDENTLTAIFDDISLPPSEWKNILKSLKPLLIEENNYYTILHNDVRVFFAGILNADPDYVTEISCNIVTYYLNQKIKTESYYHDIIRFMIMSERFADIALILKPDFVIEAYVNRVSLNELREVGNDELKRQIKKQQVNWFVIQQLYTYFATISQIETSKIEIEESCDFVEKYIPHLVQYHECFVESLNNWDTDLICKVLQCVAELYENGKEQRAINTFSRWFSDLTITDIWNSLINNGLLHQMRFEDDEILSDDAKQIGKLLGKAICWSNAYEMLNITVVDSAQKEFFFYISDSLFNEICRSSDTETIKKYINYCKGISRDNLMTNIKRLLYVKEYSKIGAIENALRERLLKNEEGCIIDYFLRIVANTISNDFEEAFQKYCVIKKNFGIQRTTDSNELFIFLILAIVSGYLERDKDHIVVASEITDIFMKAYSFKNRSYYAVLYNICVSIGQWIYSKQFNKVFYQSAEEIGRLLKRLLIENWKVGDSDYRLFEVLPIGLIALIDLADDSDEKYRVAIKNFFEEYYKEYPISRPTEPGIYFFRNEPERIIEWKESNLGSEGKVWELPIGERNTYIHKFIESIYKYGLTDIIDICEILERSRWSIIGYASHKEYSVSELLESYNELVERNPSYIQKYARTIMEISIQSDELGDNRASWEVNRKIYHDLFFSGIESIKGVFAMPEDVCRILQEPTLLANGIIGYLEGNSFFEKRELISLWIFFNGILDSRDSTNGKEFKKCILLLKKAAIENGFVITDYDLKKYGLNGYNSIFFQEKQSALDTTVEIINEDAAIMSIHAYISGKDSNLYASTIVDCLEVLKQNDQVYLDSLHKLAENEFSQEIHGLQYETLKQYILRNLPLVEAENYIVSYLMKKFDDNRFYVAADLREISKILMYHLDEEYSKQSIESIISMQRSWQTASGHLPDFSSVQSCSNITESIFYEIVQIEDKTTIFDLLFRWLMVCLLCDDADQVYISLQSLYQLISLDNKYVKEIEENWQLYHYRAKEWIIMIYELLLTKDCDFKEVLYGSILKHTEDDDFNIVLYSWMIIFKFYPEIESSFAVKHKLFFDNIPDKGYQKLIYAPNENPWVTDLSMTYSCLRRMERLFCEQYVDIEKRVVSYNLNNNYSYNIISTNRRKQIKVVIYPLVKALFDVIYKDLYRGRWDASDLVDLASVLLSGTEPSVLLQPADWWTQSGGYIIEDVDQFLNQTPEEQKKGVQSCFSKGLLEDEVVIGGVLIDYSHKVELHCYMITYLDWDMNCFINPLDIQLYNKRFLWHDLDCYFEEVYSNLTVLNKGVESFRDTLLPCVLSKTVMDNYGWKIKYEDGFKIYSQSEEIIGRFEKFDTINHDFYNRTTSNVPMIMRWVLRKSEYDSIISETEEKKEIIIIPLEAHQ